MKIKNWIGEEEGGKGICNGEMCSLDAAKVTYGRCWRLEGVSGGGMVAMKAMKVVCCRVGEEKIFFCRVRVFRKEFLRGKGRCVRAERQKCV